MKPHRILKSFKGSQTGNDHHHFEAETVADLSDDLATIVVKAGWAKEHVEHTQAEARETKVVAPEETKDEEQPKKKKK